MENPTLEKGSVSSSPHPSTVPNEPTEIDGEEERKLVKKLDWALIPLFTLMYITNFVDRTAIGNAKVAGLEQDLGMSGADFNVALTIFYVFYTAADIPSNLILKKYGTTWLAILVIAFGIIALFSAFMTSFSGLIATRIFLGLAEGGTLSGLVYTLSQYYRRSELILRIGVFFGMAPSLSGAFGGFLASGLLKVPDFGRIKAWRKIFLIEGILTIAIGTALLFLMPGEPGKTKLLTPEQRILAVERCKSDRSTVKEKSSVKLVLRSFNVHTVICTLIFVILNVSFQGLSIFLPTIIRGLGNYSTIEVQLRTVPPYIVGAFWAVGISLSSFHFKNRAIPLLSTLLLLVVGYAVAISTTDPKVRYGACFLMIMGGASGAPVTLTWGTENAAPDTMRAVASAAIPGIGALGSLLSIWTYVPTDAPQYRNGNTANLASSSLGCALTIGLAFYLRRENAKRQRGELDHVLEGKSADEVEQLGYRNPDFRYQI
ncbi:major facilitator superfamily domain-containing protein [Coprinopsis sp. MPI-PUGE-AT-0042]|nr:major facilitator superfamily domain-containing protein [Coprinopsis sp. MPI-PUGE-AT-0042]